MSREHLFTARWHLNANQAVPLGGPRESLLAMLAKELGGAPPAIPVAPEPSPPREEEFISGDLPPIKDVAWMVPPSKSFPIVGAAFTADQFRAYLAGIDNGAMTWDPSAVTIHHTASPSLAQRPDGFLPQHMLNLRSWYQSLGWNRGPHIFVDDKRIWVFSPLTAKGIHAVSFNSTAFGIEILGDYDTEDPKSGRGLAACTLAAEAAEALRIRFGTTKLNFHRDDPKSSKTCPGRKISLDWFQSLA
jgi:hypothetical protein